MTRSWQAEQERLLRNELAELDEEMNDAMMVDSTIASKWVHLQNIESSNKLLARLKKYHGQPSLPSSSGCAANHSGLAKQ